MKMVASSGAAAGGGRDRYLHDLTIVCTAARYPDAPVPLVVGFPGRRLPPTSSAPASVAQALTERMGQSFRGPTTSRRGSNLGPISLARAEPMLHADCRERVERHQPDARQEAALRPCSRI